MSVERAISTRKSIRSFLEKPIPRQDLEAVLNLAARAPSGSNIQPWKVYALTGDSKSQLSRKISETYRDPEAVKRHKDSYQYYPVEWKSPFIERRRKVGWDLYALLGIEKSDKNRMHEQLGKNYDFFGAPVGLVFTIDRMMEQGSWLDYGMFLENVMLLARSRGWDTCPQAAFIQFHEIVLAHIGAPQNEEVVCGMSLGYANPVAVENSLETERESVNSFAKFLS